MKKKYKILFIDQSLSGGGAERVMCTVIRDLDPEKFDIHLLLISGEGMLTHLIPEHVKKTILGIPNTRKALFATIREIWKIKPEIIYTTTVRTAMLVLISRLFCPNLKTIVRFPCMPKQIISEKLLSYPLINLLKFILKQADYLIAQTDEMANELKKIFLIPTKIIYVIPNPLDINYINSCLINAKSPFPNNKINILASGTLSKIKGFDILIKAFAIVFKKNNNYHLHIIGREESEYMSTLKQLAFELKVEQSITFHGFQQNPYPFYKFCDIFVLSSRMEAFPNVLLENLYLGSPIIATRCAKIIEELIVENQNGFLVPCENPEEMAKSILECKMFRSPKLGDRTNQIVSFIEQIGL